MKRFVVLRATRWLPTGLLLPILVLLLTDRGLTLGQIGIGFVAQGVMVFALELPTGGLADALGRRPVLLFATVLEACSMLVLFVADTVGELILLFALQGIYRALDSGPLDAWYVDAVQAANPDDDVTKGLSAGSTAISLAIAAGALISGGLVAWHPFETMSALALPVAVAAVLRLVDLGFIAALMTEQNRQVGPNRATRTGRTIRASRADRTRRGQVLGACGADRDQRNPGAHSNIAGAGGVDLC